MQTCPHCEQQTITNLEKLFSVNFSPVCCKQCGKYSYLHVIHGLKALTFWIVVTWIFIGLAWFSKASFLLVGTIPALYLAINHFMLGSPMRTFFVEK